MFQKMRLVKISISILLLIQLISKSECKSSNSVIETLFHGVDQQSFDIKEVINRVLSFYESNFNSTEKETEIKSDNLWNKIKTIFLFINNLNPVSRNIKLADFYSNITAQDSNKFKSRIKREIALPNQNDSTSANETDYYEEVHEYNSYFSCSPKQLKLIYELKDDYNSFDLIISHSIINDLFAVQARALQNFFEIKFPDDWQDNDKVKVFINSYNNFIKTLVEREDLIVCDILSNLLVIRYHNISKLNSFSLINSTYPIAVNQTDCQIELEDLSNFTKSLDYNFDQNATIFQSAEQKFKKVVDCFFKDYLKITAFNKKYENIYTIRDLELKLVILLVKSNIHLGEKLEQLSDIVQDLVFKLTL